MNQLRHFKDGGTDDDRRGDQEGKMRGGFVGQAGQQSADHGRARARNAGEKGRALPQADGQRPAKTQRVEFQPVLAGAQAFTQLFAEEQEEALTIRKPAAIVGTPNKSLSLCSNKAPSSTAGIVATITRPSVGDCSCAPAMARR